MELNRNKTDKADAQLIARYCEHAVLTGDCEKKLYQPKGEDYEAIQRLVTRCDQLEKSKKTLLVLLTIINLFVIKSLY